MDLDVLFINPPFRLIPPFQYKLIDPPRNLALLAATIREKGHSAAIIDMPILEMGFDEIVDKIESNPPKIIAISNRSTYSFPIVCKLATIIKKAFPHTPIIVGGTYVSFAPQEALKSEENIDIVVIGEGEITLSNLVKKIISRKDFSKTKGIAYRDDAGNIVRNEDSEPIKDLSIIPLPALDLLPIEKYVERKERYILDTTRGCLYGCDYCTSSYTKFSIRYRPIEQVMDEIKLAYNLGFENFYFFDDLFTANKKLAVGICKEIVKNKIKIKWPCMTRLNLVNDEVLGWMKKAGCDLVAYGVESTSERYLKDIGKLHQLKKTEEIFELTKQHGIRPLAFVIFGLPKTTFKDEMETIKFINKIGADAVGAFSFKPYPGTIYYSHPSDHGIRIIDNNFSRWSQLDEPTHETKHLTKDEIVESMLVCNYLFRSGGTFANGIKYRRKKNVVLIRTEQGGVIYNPNLEASKRKTDMYLSCKKLDSEYYEVLLRCDGYHNKDDICNIFIKLFHKTLEDAEQKIKEIISLSLEIGLVEEIPDVMEYVNVEEQKALAYGGGLV